ncbi:MAG: extracellular solute-binding protein [Bosea sp. (in: a-proteobacteria)]
MIKLAMSTLAITLAWSSAAPAAEPVGAPAFNVTTTIDLKALTPANLVDTLKPKAKAEGEIVFYDFTESFGPLFNDHLIPRFEKKYGLKVKHVQAGPQAVQQLIAAKQAGQPSPVDVYFIGNGNIRTANEAGIIANLPLHTMLPSAQDLDQLAATVARGYKHGGIVVPFHRNVTAIGYDTRFIPKGREPKTFAELMAYAKANPGKVAFTNPARGGSGQGILESAILALATEPCKARLFDFSVTPDEAKAWAESECMTPVLDWFRAIRPSVEITNGNTDTLTLMANGQAHVGTVWEDQTYDFSKRGLVPPSVRVRLLENGQVGDGDGVMIPAGTTRLAGALLFTDFLLSDEAQLLKLELNGSRSARTKLDVASAIKPEMLEKLIPGEQYATLARPRIVATISAAATTRFVSAILQTP